MGADGVSIVIARDDRDPSGIGQQRLEGVPRGAELDRQGRGRQVAGDEDVVGLERGDALDDLAEPLEAELAGPPDQERAPSPASRLLKS